MDYKGLSKSLSRVSDSTSRKTVMNRVSDAAEARRAAVRKKAISDSFRRRIKDELENTESTEEAVNVALDALNEGIEPAEVVTATIEILGGVVDKLEGANAEVPAEENAEEDDANEEATEDLADARRRRLVADARARIAARSRRQQLVADARARIAARKRQVSDAQSRRVVRKPVSDSRIAARRVASHRVVRK